MGLKMLKGANIDRQLTYALQQVENYFTRKSSKSDYINLSKNVPTISITNALSNPLA